MILLVSHFEMWEVVEVYLSDRSQLGRRWDAGGSEGERVLAYCCWTIEASRLLMGETERKGVSPSHWH